MARGALVLTTKFEKLMDKINAERNIFDQLCNHECRKESCERSIVSVYQFMLKALRMPERPISFDEYKVAENKMKEVACHNIARILNRVFHPIKTRRWTMFLKYGAFWMRKTTLGHFYGHTPWTGDMIGGEFIYFPENLSSLVEELMEYRYPDLPDKT